MIFDALDRLTFTAASGQTLPNSDKYNATVTSTNYSDAFSLGTGGIGYTQPMYIVVRYNAATNASGSNTIQFDVQKSTDGSTGWVTHTSGERDKITLSTTAQANAVNIPIETREGYVRLATTVAGGGSTPTVTILSADINVAPL